MSWSFDIRVFFSNRFESLLTSDMIEPEDFWRLPFAAPEIFVSDIHNIRMVEAQIFDDVTTLKPRQFAATARPGMLFCVDPDELIMQRSVPGFSPGDSCLTVRLWGVAQHLEFTFCRGTDVITGSTDRDSPHEHWRFLSQHHPWQSAATPFEVSSSSQQWDEIERIAFDLLTPFFGANYLTYNGDEPTLAVYDTT